MASFNEMDKMILTALGASTVQVERLESMGFHTKNAIAAIGSAQTLSAMAGMDSAAATNIFAWASIDLETNGAQGSNAATGGYTVREVTFKIEPLDHYTGLIHAAQEAAEINTAQIASVSQIHAKLDASSLDTNEVYNFARSLSIMMEPALNKIYGDETVSAASQELLGITEAFFKKAIEMFHGFGRARIMYAYLLCMQKRFQETIDIVEMALTLPEGGQDWMTAAYWYLTAKAALGDTYAQASEVYETFKEHAAPNSREARYVENTLVHYFE